MIRAASIKMMHYLRRLGHTAGEAHPPADAIDEGCWRSIQSHGWPEAIRKHQIYPYLLRGVEIIRANQVWATDITQYHPAGSRILVIWWLLWTGSKPLCFGLAAQQHMDASFCVECLEEALRYGEPEIFNNDQGAQLHVDRFYARSCWTQEFGSAWTGEAGSLTIFFIERLWRTVKYGNIYIQEYLTMSAAHHGLGKYFNVYNTERLHLVAGLSNAMGGVLGDKNSVRQREVL